MSFSLSPPSHPHTHTHTTGIGARGGALLNIRRRGNQTPPPVRIDVDAQVNRCRNGFHFRYAKHVEAGTTQWEFKCVLQLGVGPCQESSLFCLPPHTPPWLINALAFAINTTRLSLCHTVSMVTRVGHKFEVRKKEIRVHYTFCIQLHKSKISVGRPVVLECIVFTYAVQCWSYS